ncbi:cell division protein FtsK [Actinobacillus porcinus]|uniref:DNA translocase FtsK n=1 Tax=Actinobacillus porcinus TaxID=51048 RepID=A0ABY6TIN8_9PAST|nr:DNA translocase FtsK [Actinobacillus porcinus]VFY92781.1 cell division protein FtsK [Actinobacillus porcinus]VTU07249.1 cell division protein FtsK [Actinobacillus porcinus]
MIKKLTSGFTPQHYFVEFLFGLTALFGFYLIIAWSSYSPIDSAWSVSTYQTEVINKSGKLGAWVMDLFFVFFGKVGNILPFLICIAPIYFIRTKRVDSLTWTRFSLRMFGFVMLMLGLTSLCSLLLDSDNYHLAGGVVGGSLVQHLFPTLGQFGVLLFAFITSIIGFIFCSGASLIRLIVKFYHWLTVQNESEEKQIEQNDAVVSQESVETQDIEKPIAPWQQTLESQAEQAEQLNINIEGLNSVQTQASPSPIYESDDNDDVSSLGEYQVETSEKLPEVSIASVSLPKVEPEMPISLSTAESAVGFEDDLTDTPRMPEVKLAPKPIFPVETSADELSLDKDDELGHLATAFAAQEAERENMRQKQAQEMGIALETENHPKPEQNGLRSISVDKVIEMFGSPKSTEKPTTAMPTLDLLDQHSTQTHDITPEELQHTSRRIEAQLRNFNVKAEVRDVLVGPVVTRYELELQPGVKASKVTSIDTDLARALTFKAIRVAETIPGKPYIGIETPNAKRQTVYLRDVLDSEEFRNSKALLPMALGKDISGKAVVIDLAKTPHLLVAGSTGSGKSVGINTMILSLLYRVKPEDVKFIMIDPKVVELSVYNDIPHLLTEVVTDMRKAANALRWCVEEMERRYQLLAQVRVRNIEGFNDKIDELKAEGYGIPDPLWKPSDSMDSTAPHLGRMNYIVVIVDEFADLMMVAGKQIEELIARLTQKARAVGIHVILATQRPSVDVITGLIKSNIPSRIAFTVVQRNDSRTILDQNGAEALLGRGDMLYLANGTTELMRVHGAFMTDDEVNRVADDWRARGKPNYISAILESVGDDEEVSADDAGYAGDSDELDPLFDKAVEVVSSTGMTSTSFIQRRLKIGFNRAANIMDQMEEQGIVSEMRNGKRELLVRNTSEY